MKKKKIYLICIPNSKQLKCSDKNKENLIKNVTNKNLFLPYLTPITAILKPYSITRESVIIHKY